MGFTVHARNMELIKAWILTEIDKEIYSDDVETGYARCQYANTPYANAAKFGSQQYGMISSNGAAFCDTFWI